MRQRISSGSVSAVFLNRKELDKALRKSAFQAMDAFPEIRQIRLFGSLSRGEDNPLSDVDLIVALDRLPRGTDPLEITKPYFRYFSNSLCIAVDVLVTDLENLASLEKTVGGSITLVSK